MGGVVVFCFFFITCSAFGGEEEMAFWRQSNQGFDKVLDASSLSAESVYDRFLLWCSRNLHEETQGRQNISHLVKFSFSFSISIPIPIRSDSDLSIRRDREVTDKRINSSEV